MALTRRRAVVPAQANGKSAPEQEPEQHHYVDPDRPLLGQLLVEKKTISTAQLTAALNHQSASGKPLGSLLVELGALDETDLAEGLAAQMGLPVANLSTTAPDADAIALVPESVARAHLALPMYLADDLLCLAVADPSPHNAQSLAKALGRPVGLLVAPASDIKRTLDATYRLLGGVDHLIAQFAQTAAATTKRQETTQAQVNENAPVVQVVNLLITQALRDRASDVHIEPQDSRLRIRFRIDGALHDVLALPEGMAAALTSRLKIMAGMNIVERRRPQDGQIAMDVDGRAVDIRVATTGTIWGEKVVLRILDKSRPLYRLNDLGMPVDTHEAFSKLVRAPFGMVLCAGPTGSGKTTTLYATMSEINESQRNIMTIEDPVEYVFPSINQIQMNEQAGLSFATGLKSILRQDPDVILVGEIRDVETARIATQSALTGHFVLSSLHATDAVAALHRFLDMGIESFLIASSVLAVVGQRLVRRICESCKTSYSPTIEEMDFYAQSGGRPKKKFYRGAGCNFCSNTGFSDRVGVYELLQITPEIKRLIVGWATQDELRRMAVKQGMRTLSDEGMALVENDITTVSEIVRNIYSA
jgi:type IV pilus assembly protein PilB